MNKVVRPVTCVTTPLQPPQFADVMIPRRQSFGAVANLRLSNHSLELKSV